MELSYTPEEKKNQRIAAALTAVISFLFLLLLIFLGFSISTWVEEGAEDGVMVQMGDPDAGGPDVNPSQTERIVPVEPDKSESSDPTVTTNQEEAVNIEQPDKPKNNTNQPVKEPTPDPVKEPTIDSELQRLLEETRQKQNNQSSGDGTKPGPKGEKDADGTDPDGGGSGTVGVGQGDFELGSGFGSRGLGSVPQLKSSCLGAKGGRVVLKIRVAPDGTIVSASAGQRGTSVSDPCLTKEAEKMALKVKLTPVAGSQYMEGMLTIRFR